ncbi:MAG TPA: DUF3732 domain-containing protein [Tepidisphaeraceae bacterium]|nr:DUF3732 domain-containing protein [Tepidisphaeraceae bacterium]
MQILQIVLYSHSGEQRSLKFHPGRVNIITGDSNRGKTALIEIIDYCLGREHCTVPEGPIRESVSWYGLLMTLGAGQIFVARPSPPAGSDLNERIHLELGTNLKPPPLRNLRQTTNRDGLVADLTRSLGISPNKHVPPVGHVRPPLEANMRHALFLCLQKQTEIANQDFMFHRETEQSWIGQSIKDTLPYFLGAVAEDRLSRTAELSSRRRELRDVQRRMLEEEDIRGTGASRARVLAAEAQAVGLIAENLVLESDEHVIDALRSLRDWSPNALPSTPGDELNRLLVERTERVRSLYALEHEIEAAESLYVESEQLTSELDEQRRRLQSIGLFRALERNNPMEESGSTRAAVDQARQWIQESLADVDSQIAHLTSEGTRLDPYLQERRAVRADTIARIQVLSEAIDATVRQQRDYQDQRTLETRRAHVVGRVSLFLETVKLTSRDGGLAQRDNDLQRRVAELQQELDEEDAEVVLQAILNQISNRITEWAPRLDHEYKNSDWVFDLSHLTVAASSGNRYVPMKRMGGGKNWLGCHLLAHLALHEWFTKNKRPTPRFLFLDQPTIGFYGRDRRTERDMKSLKDPDRLQVRRIFEWLFEVVNSLAPHFQLIVTEHVDLRDDKAFQDVVVASWWDDGEALVPRSWYSAD